MHHENIDIFYTSHLPICNDYLLRKWRKIINIWPRWLIYPLNVLNNNSDFVAIASVDKIDLLKIDDIVFCKADGKYTEIFLQNGTKIVSSKNIGEYQQLFPSHHFFRIHNSTLINVHQIVRINKKDGLYCELINGHGLPVAKRKERDFLLYLREK